MRLTRAAGILLHPTSFPAPFGIGEIGEAAFRFVDFLAESAQSLWQVLPLGPTGYGDSPYASFSSMAGNPLLVNLSWLEAEGDVEAEVLQEAPPLRDDQVDYGQVIPFKMGVLRHAALHFRQQADEASRARFERFCEENRAWLEDYALFMALKDAHNGAAWNTWEWELASRQPEALAEWKARLEEAIFIHKYIQFRFFEQWGTLHSYANEKGVQIIGDLPIFVAYDSVDVWANPRLFKLDENLLPTVVAGVPPDYFSETGQLWGNPLYRWDVMAEEGYTWWVERIRQTLKMVDLIRLDHFRGFVAAWEIPAGEPTAVNGRWVEGPGEALFRALEAALGDLPLIAEDLGFITPEVEALRERLGLPGMKILQFAFGTDAANPYLPHNYEPNVAVYTGTHDNETLVGWARHLSPRERDNLHRYLGPVGEDLHWALIRLAYRSVADLAIIPLQDVLGLGNEARMNRPGHLGGNWSWRYRADALHEGVRARLREMALAYGRIEPQEAIEMPSYM